MSNDTFRGTETTPDRMLKKNNEPNKVLQRESFPVPKKLSGRKFKETKKAAQKH